LQPAVAPRLLAFQHLLIETQQAWPGAQRCAGGELLGMTVANTNLS